VGFSTARSLALARAAAEEAGDRLDQQLLAPLRRDLGDRPLVLPGSRTVLCSGPGLLAADAEVRAIAGQYPEAGASCL
jgi:hypothetical protein